MKPVRFIKFAFTMAALSVSVSSYSSELKYLVEEPVDLLHAIHSSPDRFEDLEKEVFDVYFLDHPIRCTQLKDSGVLARLRIGEDKKDSTIKLRPMFESDLPEHLQDHSKINCESDWIGKDEALAPSCAAKRKLKLELETIRDIIKKRKWFDLFNSLQLELAQLRAILFPDTMQLAALGPAQAQRWEWATPEGLKATIENWQGLREEPLWELSIDADDVSEAEIAATRIMKKWDLDWSPFQISKTQAFYETFCP